MRPAHQAEWSRSCNLLRCKLLRWKSRTITYRLTISPADGRIGRLELEAADLDAFIRKLTECRSRMLPVHPAEPPADPEPALSHR